MWHERAAGIWGQPLRLQNEAQHAMVGDQLDSCLTDRDLDCLCRGPGRVWVSRV